MSLYLFILWGIVDRKTDALDRTAINNLAQEGVLFSTLDEQHYVLC
jgi:hypothetical protein